MGLLFFFFPLFSLSENAMFAFNRRSRFIVSAVRAAFLFLGTRRDRDSFYAPANHRQRLEARNIVRVHLGNK